MAERNVTDFIGAKTGVSKKKEEQIYQDMINDTGLDNDFVQEQLKKQFIFNALSQSMFGMDDEHASTLEQVKIPENSKSKELYQQVLNKLIDDTNKIINNKEKINILLSGDAGVGKTYLAIAVMNTMFVNHFSTFFVNSLELKNLLYSSFRDDHQKALLEKKINFMKKVDLLIIDDLGTEASNKSSFSNEAGESIQQTLYDISNSRINKPTLITSNFRRDELSEIYNEKLISRLAPKNNGTGIVLGEENFNDLR